jgi:hypothetical protein
MEEADPRAAGGGGGGAGAVARICCGQEDIGLIEDLLRESRGWALVDNLAASVAGDLVERFPRKLAPVLDRWAKDGDFWLRRSALLALLLPLRRGGGDFARFCRYADGMLAEKEFFIRKAIGWVLRETAKKTPERVVDWLLPRAARASGLTVREACKHLPARDKQRIVRRRRKRVDAGVRCHLVGRHLGRGHPWRCPSLGRSGGSTRATVLSRSPLQSDTDVRTWRLGGGCPAVCACPSRRQGTRPSSSAWIRPISRTFS